MDKAIIGRIVKNGEKFEVFLDPDNAYAYIEKKKPDLRNILISDEIFKDAKKGDRQGPMAVKKAFGTDDIYVILKEIFDKGEVQLTTEQKKNMAEEKKKKILGFITREAIDARTNAPIPEKRIELAMEEIRFHVDPFKPAEQQVNDLIKELRLKIPIKFEKVRLEVRILAEYSSRAYGVLKYYGLKNENWTSSGELVGILEIPAGIQGEVLDKLNKATQGTVQVKITQQ
ncbi:MAG: ribosome assembly factor SBDS [Candidatus Micrarchaeota archaeon]|nr:ribosome assembly factor SBDS [Candidatus Micrarchaeota archaeon]